MLVELHDTLIVDSHARLELEHILDDPLVVEAFQEIVDRVHACQIDVAHLRPDILIDHLERLRTAISSIPCTEDGEGQDKLTARNESSDEELRLDEVDLAILKVLAKYGHSLPFTDISAMLPSGKRRTRKIVATRCKALQRKALLKIIPRKGALITSTGKAVISNR